MRLDGFGIMVDDMPPQRSRGDKIYVLHDAANAQCRVGCNECQHKTR